MEYAKPVPRNFKSLGVHFLSLSAAAFHSFDKLFLFVWVNWINVEPAREICGVVRARGPAHVT